jgi:hypothetical protein
VTAAATWGPLAEAVHEGAAGSSDPPWRENAFFSVWDHDRGAAAIVHVSTSPNAEGRRARASAVVGGHTRELVEALEPLELSSPSITIDLEGAVSVEGDGLALELTFTPRFVVADYTRLHGLLTPLGDAPPMQHFQRGADVTGWIEIDGERVSVNGQGVRDRTWGFRDDQRGNVTVEYLAGSGCFPTFDFTVMKMLKPDGSTTAGGFVMRDEARRITACEITRDAAGLLAQLDLVVDGGEEITLPVTPLPAGRLGFWIPLGVARKGAALSAYDEFVLFDGAGGRGGGVMEHGVVRRL